MSAEVKQGKQELNCIKKLPERAPWVLPVNCDGCGTCANLCKIGCLKMTETNRKGIFVPWLEEPHRCTGCGRCANSCAMGAISMTSYVDRAVKRFQEKRPELPCEDAS